MNGNSYCDLTKSLNFSFFSPLVTEVLMVSNALFFGSCYVATLIFFAITGNIPAEVIAVIPGVMYITLRFKKNI